MSLEAIAALLGHRDLKMTLVYARIADRKVADEYFAVTEQVEALYNSDLRALPASAEGTAMRRLRQELERRDVGNGYCTRPASSPAHSRPCARPGQDHRHNRCSGAGMPRRLRGQASRHHRGQPNADPHCL
jgi:hypothetical protein